MSSLTTDELSDLLQNLKFTEILDLPSAVSLNGEDTLVLVSSTNKTTRASVEQFMQFLNENLHNFIMWKPIVRTQGVISWERSNDDTIPDDIVLTELVFPLASTTQSGMITKEDFIKLSGIQEDEIVYLDKLTEELAKKAQLVHVHDQYQKKEEMPTKLSDFTDDLEYVKPDEMPTKLSDFANDTEYLTEATLPVAGEESNGIMTSTLYNLVQTINTNYLSAEDLEEIQQTIIANIPTNVSAFENDMNYVTSEALLSSLGEIGAINLINDSKFAFIDEVNYWLMEGTASVISLADPAFTSCGKLTIPPDSSVYQQINFGITQYFTMSFYVKAGTATSIDVTIFKSKSTVSVSTGWTKITLSVNVNLTDYDSTVKFTVTDNSSQIIYLTAIKLERGRFATEYYPSAIDNELLHVKASETRYGTVMVDDETCYIDAVDGKLKVRSQATGQGVEIDEVTPTWYTTYSSQHIENIAATKASLDANGKILSSQLPEFLDDVLVGHMNSDKTAFIVDPGQYGPSEPSTSIIYIDNLDNNTAYIWTGTAYSKISASSEIMTSEDTLQLITDAKATASSSTSVYSATLVDNYLSSIDDGLSEVLGTT